ncbi:MAG: Transcriptional regulator, MerR family [Labilithrix sp.]|nr:Transcriptional regulator, MerR family [Labilithrix sp.]
MSSLPSKLFFRIGEVAGLVGVEPHVLRYWEREFRSIRPTKSAKGQRVYSRKDVENLLRVRDLLYRDGFTIAGAKKRMQRADGSSPGGDAVAADDEVAFEDEPDAVSGEHVRDVAPSVPSAALAAEEAPAPPAEDGSRQAREKLVLLRAEVEAFLEELT